MAEISPGQAAFGMENRTDGAAGVQRGSGWRHKQGMTGDLRSYGELLAGLPGHRELMAVLYERHGADCYRLAEVDAVVADENTRRRAVAFRINVLAQRTDLRLSRGLRLYPVLGDCGSQRS